MASVVFLLSSLAVFRTHIVDSNPQIQATVVKAVDSIPFTFGLYCPDAVVLTYSIISAVYVCVSLC